MKRVSKALMAVLLLMIPWSVQAQITFVIDKLPLHTPQDESIFIVGSFNDWNPSDPKFQLKKNTAGKYSIQLPEKFIAFEYKFTRGDWKTVEGTWDGKSLANRVFISNTSIKTVVNINIESWEDLASQVTFKVIDIPKDTSPHDPIFLTGSFNHWVVADSNFQLHQEKGNIYSITLPSHLDSFEYKFNRGSWETVECLENGKYKPNRLYVKKGKEPETVRISIDAWEDYQKYQFSSFEFVMLLLMGYLFFQGLLYLGDIITKEQQFLSFILLWGSSVVLFLVFLGGTYFLKNYAPWWEPYTFLTPLFILALIFYTVQQMLDDSSKWPYIYLSLLMFAGVIYWNIRKAMMEGDVIVEWLGRSLMVDNLILKLFTWIGVVLSVLLLKQWLRSGTRNNSKAYSYGIWKHKKAAVYKIYKCLIAVASISLLSIVIQGVRILLFKEEFSLQDASDYIFWIAWMYWSVYLTYWIHQNNDHINPLRLKAAIETVQPSEKREIQLFKERIKEVMVGQQIFTNPELTLNDLASLMNIPAHKLSKMIHLGFDRSFPELVNDFRVQSFVQKVYAGSAEKNTLLAIAYEVGFKSKSTFNRAFKKSTGKTPSEYFSNHKTVIVED